MRLFEGIPSYDNSTGKAATYCGPLANQRCGNYADQLYWLTRDYRYGSSTLEAPLVGATFTNFDLSWAHEWRDGSAFKLTPFYRRGYNVIEQTAQIVGFNYQTGSPIFGDVAILQSGHSKSDRRRGALQPRAPARHLDADRRDLHQSVRQRAARHVLAAGGASLGLGLPLAGSFAVSDERRFQLHAARKGWRIDPVIGFNVGYPYGQGYYTAVYCNGIAVIVPATSLSVIYSRSARLYRSARSGHLHEAEYRRDARHPRAGTRRRPAHDAARRRRSHDRVPAAGAQRRTRAVRLRLADRQTVQSAL